MQVVLSEREDEVRLKEAFLGVIQKEIACKSIEAEQMQKTVQVRSAGVHHFLLKFCYVYRRPLSHSKLFVGSLDDTVDATQSSPCSRNPACKTLLGFVLAVQTFLTGALGFAGVVTMTYIGSLEVRSSKYVIFCCRRTLRPRRFWSRNFRRPPRTR